MGNTASDTRTATNLLPISTISIPEFFSKINPKDYKILKYVPDEFLQGEQLTAKERALEEDRVKYRNASSAGKYSIGTGEDFETKMLRLVEQYGAQPKGFAPERDVAIPKSITGTDHVARRGDTRRKRENLHRAIGGGFFVFM